MNPSIYRCFAILIVALYCFLGLASLACRQPREAVISLLFAASNAAIYLWR